MPKYRPPLYEKIAIEIRTLPIRGTKGNDSRSLRPSVWRGCWGPGTLVTPVWTPRLGDPAARRPPRASSNGGAKPESEVRTSPATACSDSFSLSICALTESSLSTGSSVPTGNVGSIADTWLLYTPRSPAWRIDTGTRTRTPSPSMFSPRLWSSSLNPPATIVNTMSLTVPPRAERIALTSLRCTWAVLHVRCGPIDPVSDDAPSGRSNPAVELTPRARACTFASDARGRRTAARNARSCSDGLTVWRVKVCSTSCALVGSGAGCQRCPGGCGGVASNITVIRSVADTPSTMQ